MLQKSFCLIEKLEAITLNNPELRFENYIE